MTDRGGFYSNYRQRQRSANLLSNANDLIIYFRTVPHASNIQLNKKGEERMKKGGGEMGGGWAIAFGSGRNDD